MAKIEIIGHRGAAGTTLENTMASFRHAAALGVRTIEFDVRVTQDGQFVICHDATLIRVSDSIKRIKDLTYAELQAIPLYNNETVPLLSEVLNFARKRKLAVIIEIKISSSIEELCDLLDTYSDLALTVALFDHEAAAHIRTLRPHYRIYLAERDNPVAVLQTANAMNAQGIDLNYMLINPLTYFLARRWKLDIMLYTVNMPMVVRLLRILYPGVIICTDHPERFIS